MRRILVPVLALAVTACKSNTPALRAACATGNADACAIVGARLIVGTDGKTDEAEAATFFKREMELRAQACAAGVAEECTKLTARGMLLTPTPMDPPKGLDLPKVGGGEVQMVLGVELHVDGSIVVDGKALANDDAVLGLARERMQQSPDLRAVLRADAAVTHGRVIRVLDLLKQAGISKIAFAVVPVAPADAGRP